MLMKLFFSKSTIFYAEKYPMLFGGSMRRNWGNFSFTLTFSYYLSFNNYTSHHRNLVFWGYPLLLFDSKDFVFIPNAKNTLTINPIFGGVKNIR